MSAKDNGLREVDMEQRKIGALEVSTVGLGTNNFGGRLSVKDSASVLDAAVDAGINFIDTADIYNRTASESCIGEWLRHQKRDESVIATKFGLPFGDHRGGASPDYVKWSLEGSLRRLRTEYVDLFILHRPDPRVPIAHTLEALADLVTEGKVLEIGCSGFSREQLVEAGTAASTVGLRFVNLQSEYSLLKRSAEDELLPSCRALNIGFTAYRPLAHGLLSGKYRRGQEVPSGARLASVSEQERNRFLSPQNLDVVEALAQFAADRGRTVLEIAVARLLGHQEVSSVIAGAMSPEQITVNAGAGNSPLTTAEIAAVDDITDHLR
ncbi:aldo/keto reductase [Streptomyces sp. SID8361]|uniref:aldo/keto reductase n=1 Tax=Streptomyces sp. MnatMP-M27 TaxID=1839768 RepID=UPI00144CEE96|nr:aldo/keto reductase [Streptomyces sp. MnatMP-M27]MYU11184.1 aldo/keto reductase [Streptomyces sp. SID8361]